MFANIFLEGEFIVNAQLVPIITELKPGVVTVHSGATQQKFFISGGFVFVHEGSICSVNPAECVGLENLDSELAKVSFYFFFLLVFLLKTNLL